MENPHLIVEERSIALHRAIAERVREEPRLVEQAWALLARWEREEKIHPEYAAAWREVLSKPLDELLALLVDPGQRMRDLRQNTPFAGILDPETRWRIIRETRVPPNAA